MSKAMEEQLAVRLRKSERALLEEAAAIDRRPVTAFVRMAAVDEAQRLIDKKGKDGK